MYKSINGCGTSFLGATDPRGDGSFVTNKWIIFLAFPILPLRAFRVIYIGETEEKKSAETTTIGHYEILEAAPLALGEALKTYLLFLSLIG